MISPDAARNVVAVIGNVTTHRLLLSPLWICKPKDVEEVKPAPELVRLLSCMLLALYGHPIVHPNSILVATANGIGVLIQSAYIIIFLLYSPTKKRRMILAVLGVEAVFMVADVLGVLLAADTHEERSTIVGVPCVCFTSLVFFTPLTFILKVIKTKTVESLPIVWSLMFFLDCICWTAYALIIFDSNLALPNGIGAVIGAVLLILYAWYYRSTPMMSKAKNIKMPVIVSCPGASAADTTGCIVSVTIER